MHLNVEYTMIDESLLNSNVLGRDGFTWWIGRVAHPDFWKKENEISEDELKRIEAEVQKTTDHFIGLVEEELKNKEADLAEI